MPPKTQTNPSRAHGPRRGPNLGDPGQRAASGQPQSQGSEGISLQMLGIAAVASAAAAALTRMLWPGGTIVSAAMTPVIVAVVKEALWRPAERLKTGIGQLSDTGAPPLRGRALSSDKSTRLARLQALETHGQPVPEAPAGAAPYRRVYGRKRLRLKPVLITGLAGFALAAATLTLPELVLGGSLVGGSSTTFFGASAKHTRPPLRAPAPRPGASPQDQTPSPRAGDRSLPSVPYDGDPQGNRSQSQGPRSYDPSGGSAPSGSSPSQTSPSSPDSGGGSQGSIPPVPNLPPLPQP